MAASAVPWHRRGVGRQHAVRLLSADAVLTVMSTVATARRGIVAPPAWATTLASPSDDAQLPARQPSPNPERTRGPRVRRYPRSNA
jgi:hypothetical protein